LKNLILSLIFILLGVALWFLLSHTADYSFKKWDVTLENSLRHGLQELGCADADILASVHQIKKDSKGRWVYQEMTVKMPKGKTFEDLKKSLENSGAQIKEEIDNGVKTLVIERRNRVFQKIHAIPTR